MELVEFYLFLGVFSVFCIMLVYFLSVMSRKAYTCPECGEKIRVEYMRASRCSVCGALLKQDTEV
jgi:predicted RNA-binding Zn-ribbon protein involved in translation (DUF1610 family)